MCLWSILRSAEACGVDDYEVIVVDGGSRQAPYSAVVDAMEARGVGWGYAWTEYESPGTAKATHFVPNVKMLTLERGEVSYFVRPRVDVRTMRTLSDVQKLALVLAPVGESTTGARALHIGRKRLPRQEIGERGWGYVERVGNRYKMTAKINVPSLQRHMRSNIKTIQAAAKQLSATHR